MEFSTSLIQFKRIEIFLISKKIEIENSHDKAEKLFYEDKLQRNHYDE